MEESQPINVVYNSCGESAIKEMPDNLYDWGIIDVPYGLDVANMSFLKEKNTRVVQKNGNRSNPHKNKNYELSNWDQNTPPQEYFENIKRVTKNQIIFGIEYVDWENINHGSIKWIKGVPEGMSFKGYELAYFSKLPKNKILEIELLWHGMMQAKSLSEPMVQQGNKKLNEKRIHPCQKPRLLYRKFLRDFVLPGESILDTHNGSGSLRIECFLHGCPFTGHETHQKYYTDQDKRFNLFMKEYNLLKTQQTIKF